MTHTKHGPARLHATVAGVLVACALLCAGACKNDLGTIEAHVEAARCPEAKVLEVSKEHPPRIEPLCLGRALPQIFLVMKITGTSHIGTQPVSALNSRVLWKVLCFAEACEVSKIALPLDESAPFVFSSFDIRGMTPKRKIVNDHVVSLVLSKGETLTADFEHGRLLYARSDSLGDESGEANCAYVSDLSPDAGAP